MMDLDQDTVLDSLFLLGIVLVSFGAGTRLDTYMASGNYLPLALYGAFIALGFKQLVLE